MPADWRLGIVPASDTGAVEMALWSLLGARPVDILAFESFGEGWATDVVKQLRLADARVLSAPYGRLPDLARGRFRARRGVRLERHDLRRARAERRLDRRAIAQGLAICDATSAAFAMDLPWDKLDVVTWSWQKVLGGEAAHGMLALSPRAVARLVTYKPAWPMPKIFRLTIGRQADRGHLQGRDDQHALDAVRRGRAGRAALGGKRRRPARADRAQRGQSGGRRAHGLRERAMGRFPGRGRGDALLHVDLPEDRRAWFAALDADGQAKAAKRVAALLEKEGVAYDIGAYRDAPPGLRIWGGATIETADIAALLPWLDWAYRRVSAARTRRSPHPRSARRSDSRRCPKF